MSLQPTAVYPPGPYPGGPGGSSSGQQGRVWVVQPPPDQGGRFSRLQQRIPAQQQVVPSGLSNSLPKFMRGSLNNRAIVFNMWIIAMIYIGYDEWHNLGVLPRPARWWDTSLLYGLLAILGFVDAMVPLANILAIGFTIALAMKYYQGGITPGGTTKTTVTSTPSKGPTPSPET
jgi:hypothetical protein